MAKVKAWKNGQAGEPGFPDDYEIAQHAVLQVTDIKSNHNKYYALELHTGKLADSPCFRVYTHYGRTDDLERDPGSGQKECRYYNTLAEAQGGYQSIYNQKTSPRKGYKEVSLAASNIGSQRARGASSGYVDEKTLKKIEEEQNAQKSKNNKKSKNTKKQTKSKFSLPDAVRPLIRYIYDEATAALTSAVNAQITANGIQTPLGVLTIGQIEKGGQILEDLHQVFKRKKSTARTTKLEQLSSDFYTVIPHRIGRTRQAVQAAVIDTLEDFETKQNTLQLMKDMLQVNGEEGDLLHNAQEEQEYEALHCAIEPIDPDSTAFQELEEYLVMSQIKKGKFRVVNLFALQRGPEWKAFREDLSNQRLLLHGSRISNWVGILSRGILMPKIVTAMGVNRTDAGWLGNGVYFGDAVCTSSFYTTPGRQKTRLMAIANVALGKMKEYYKITYGLEKPPANYDSCHGVRRQKNRPSEFDDDEFVIYDLSQQRLEYLVEFTL